MQVPVLAILLLSLGLTEGFFFSSKDKCPIKKYSSSKYIAGEPLLINTAFNDRMKAVEKAAKDCKVHIYIKGSYYQLPNPSQQVLISDADLLIGHGFRFEVRNENNALLCNKLCLSRNPSDMPEVKCFLQAVASNGLTWSRYSNSDVISDSTYASNTNGYSTLKTDIQTKCQKENFKRELLRSLRRMYEEEAAAESDQENEYVKKK